ncbi:MAG: hypothetical protein LBU55_00225 [Elusimicrobiota bacterium]|jgi:hypothetical protein|nr:hypothetical protein [Elusimicrobiota bacterium]
MQFYQTIKIKYTAGYAVGMVIAEASAMLFFNNLLLHKLMGSYAFIFGKNVKHDATNLNLWRLIWLISFHLILFQKSI